MEANNRKTSDMIVVNLKRKQAYPHATCPNGAQRPVIPQWASLVSPRNKVDKQIKLNSYKRKTDEIRES
jgi:hypothetical protein